MKQKNFRKFVQAALTSVMAIALFAGCGENGANETEDQSTEETSNAVEDTEETESDGTESDDAASAVATTTEEERENIESILNLANNEDQEWTYSSDSDAWVLSVVSAVAYPEIEDEQGVSVCVPGAYVIGIDTDGDKEADITAQNYEDSVKGSLVIDYDAEVTSENGQVYTASTAPVILNTGAAGYSSSTNTTAATTYAKDGYINVSCGNRGKQDSATDSDGNIYYTGDAPDCLVDQKNAVRYVKYNILLGNLPGSTEYFVSTGGSGGGAHATMFAATSNNSDYYPYEIEAGAVGVYKNEDGTYDTTVEINGVETSISDGAWGCVAYSAITSLSEADMAMAFEYYLDTFYDFNTSFQKQLASYLSEEYMEYINEQNLSVKESDVGFDLNEDGDTEDTVELSIEYDESKYADTNGYGGTYLTLYLDEFTENLQWYLDNLDYAEGWTWFNEDGTAMSDSEVAAMTSEDKATAFIEGRYAKSESSNGMAGGPGGMTGAPGGMTGAPDGMTGAPDGTTGAPDGMTDMFDGELPSGDKPDGELPSGDKPDGELPGGDMQSSDSDVAADGDTASSDIDSVTNNAGDKMVVGTPDSGTTQASGSATDSSNYSSYEEMLESYTSDIESIYAGDEYGNNIVSLYDPLQYIGADTTENPTWTRIMMGASEGDMSMFSSLNLEIAMLNAGVDADIEWQWDGGHVPSEIFGESLSLTVDQMYGKYVEGAVTDIEKEAATPQTENGDATEATGTDLSGWVNYDDITNVSFSLSAAAQYRTAGASKATPGFDVMDYGQEDYEFGDAENDARHWDIHVLEALKDHADELSALFNANGE